MIGSQDFAALCSGAAVGFSLGVIGGGGSILAVPLLLYGVGINDPHVAIGTSAVAVGINALVNLISHARARTVHWPSALVFGIAGVIGATAGSTLGKSISGAHILVLFALVMIAAAVTMVKPRSAGSSCPLPLDRRRALRLSGFGGVAGLTSGFFGIGGGFMIVPGLVLATGMPILNAIGSSLFSVAIFALTTAVNYGVSGFVAWAVAAEFIAGGAVGGVLGTGAAIRLAAKKRLLSLVFAGVVLAVAAYILATTAVTL